MVKISKKQIVSRLGLFAGAALAGVILTGCTEEVNQWWGGGQPKVEVTASVQTADPQAVTRAADGLNVASTGFSDQTQKVYIGVNKGTAGESDWTGYEFGISGTGNSQTLTPPASGPAFPSGVNSVQVYGWYPYNGGSKTFTVSGDQSSNANYNASDLMLANSAACTHDGTTVTPASLTFRHALTKMKVTVTPLSGVTINSITLKSMKKTVTINDDNKAALTVGEASSEGDITLYSGTSTAAVTQCAVFPAQSKSDALLVVNATTAGGGTAHDVTYSLSASKTFNADKEYQMNISLGPTDVRTQTITLEDWQLAEGTFNKGGGSLAFDKSTLAMAYGTPQTLKITGSVTIGAGGTPSFNVASDNESVATVSWAGTTVTVTPAGIGTATITVTDANKLDNKATCSVTVAKAAGAINSFSPTSLTIGGVGNTGSFTVDRAGDGAITATSSNTGVATVAVSGTTVTVTNVSEGSATITVKVNEGTNHLAYTGNDKTVSVTCSKLMDPKNNPLWWVAQYNVSTINGVESAGATTFMTSHSKYAEGSNSVYATCFQFADAQKTAMGGTGKIADYHLPSRAEQTSIIPCNTIAAANQQGAIYCDHGQNIFGLSGTTTFEEVACVVGGNSVDGSTSVIKKNAANDFYAIRFIGTSYCSAWHYKFQSSGSPCEGLLIESYLLSGVTTTDAATTMINNASFNSTFKNAYVATGTTEVNVSPASTDNTTNGYCQRFLPACGNSSTGVTGPASYGQGSVGNYWAATVKDSSSRWTFTFSSGYLWEYAYNVTNNFSVRLFRDN